MAHRRVLPGVSSLVLGALFLLGTTAPQLARAQGAGQGFLFQQPIGSVTLRGGYAHASANSDLFDFVTNTLTLGRSDFSSPTGQVDLAFHLAPRLDIDFGAGYARSSSPSEYRKLIDQNNQPIQQTTSFLRVPLTADLRLYLTPQGRSIGRFAWVPARFAPYVGVGGGAIGYEFKQSGDFVDPNNNVFTSELSSSGWAPEAHGVAGIDYTLSPRFALSGEAKYLWAKGKLNNDFSTFDRIDLSGFTTTAGLKIRF
jgi:hypothetical protein